MRIRIVGPGPGSAGGIGVMAGYLQSTHSTRTTLEFVESGGAPAPTALRLMRFARALLQAATADSAEVWVLAVSSGGSTWRKLMVSAILRARKVPYVVHLHSGGYPEFFRTLRPVLQRGVLGLYRNAALVAVLGRGWGDYVQKDLGVLPSRTFQMPNAVPGPDRIGVRQSPVKVLFAGRVGARKGADSLLEAWSRMETVGRAVLVLAGDVDDPDGQITTLVESARDVQTTGWLGPAAMVEQMEHAQILVLPSLAENLPLSLLEGMAWGLAPVVTPVGAVPEVVQDGQNGLLVPVGDVDALRAALDRLISDADQRSRIATSARHVWAERYSLSTYRPRFDDMVEKAAHMHGQQQRTPKGRRRSRSRWATRGGTASRGVFRKGKRS
ncbi:MULTISPECIES: glycosyltransferase family 4 protein [Kocuria]|uniref:Glycosyltransferase family 4 protein n=1 Tax=Kocuria subflava TaxID=1736139 RepID=A0A846TXD0_9MICC|nr:MULTISPECIES: glycosyltransferase family 4 protein [Kocuria]NKE09877.1 glycosyltransferase family 4 protein [Kocuria subflava]